MQYVLCVTKNIKVDRWNTVNEGNVTEHIHLSEAKVDMLVAKQYDDKSKHC